MADGVTGSTVPRRQLGRYLRDLRLRAGVTVRAASRELEWSEQKIWRIETGQVAMRALDVRAMCETYGADDEMTDALMALARETKARGWWHAYGDTLPEWFDLYIGLEESASELDWFETHLIPGLLQTAHYTNEIIRTHRPDLSDHEVERRVQLRMDRQAILTRPVASPKLRIALGEAVLRQLVGTPQVMATQLAHVAYVVANRNIQLRVVPFHTPTMGTVAGSFTVLRFPEGRMAEPPIAYVEGFTGGLYLDKPDEVEQYDAAFERIWDAALDDQASHRLIAETARSYEQQ
ncbi:helix-turn-helix transcriptional regulator [Streptomyces sp. RFCAC02]|uniref:helix-turn-helix domain-containing protein n=1 Tax=Streptomyces sp. RFCAC02 TaxID=2499143 RepID=UPI001021FEDE|nr:helix-turn-helix transcriptional regulator [Streptomyces sp. RFCAC02]